MKILIRFGDLMLKGKNIKTFINKLKNHVSLKFKNLDVEIEYQHDRIYLDFDEILLEEVKAKIMQIPGIHSYSIVYVSTKDLDEITKTAVLALDNELDDKEYTFKIETRRGDKTFPYNSNEFSKIIAPSILKNSNKKLKVDVRNPEITLNINIRHDGVYIHLNSYLAMGGFPATVAGKGLLMMSGGIDSPVAAYLAIKQGVEVELIHFESSPLTPLESVNKVYDLAQKLSVFLPNNKIKLHVVPFMEIHEQLLNNVTDSYVITIMRRMMYRIAERFANKNNIKVLINGESLGQVASQTLSSMMVVENVTNLPIIRPLITYDKKDIIDIAHHINTFDISIRPFNDCCSIYVPKNPVINPTIKNSEKEEQKIDLEPLIDKALNNIKTIIVSNQNVDFSMYGFTFVEAYENLVKENDNFKRK